MGELPPLPATDLLIAGRVIPIMPRLVQIVGLNEAIVLQQLRHLLDDERRPLVRDGRRWAAGSYADWQRRHFPFWHPDTVERAFRSLERQGAIVSAAHNASRRDHAKWYSVEFDRLLEWERVCRATLSAAPLPRDPFRPPHPGAGTGGGGGAPLPPLPATELLLDEHPLLLLPGLATLIGFDEAIVLQQVRYWLADSRRPLVREGRRWARFNQEGWHAQLSFRSRATVARAFRRLEALGLLVASSRFNADPGDRTKAYTIDFARLAALREAGANPPATVPDPPARGGEATYPQASADAAPPAASGQAKAPLTDRGGQPGAIAQNAANHGDILRRPMPQDAALAGAHGAGPPAQIAAIEANSVRRPPAHRAAAEGGDLRRSLTDGDFPETRSQNEEEEQQGPTVGTGTVVVVVPVKPTELVPGLVERGITRHVAEALVRAMPAEQVARQVAIYDRLRRLDRDDERLTPGRLRRMIEEDWAAPAHLLDDTGAPRYPRHAAPDTPPDESPTTAETWRQVQGRRAAERARRDAIGLRDADQSLWGRVVQAAPVLPHLFRSAYLYAPRRDTPGALIFASEDECRRAQGPAHATTRARIAARLAGEIGVARVQLRYIAYDDLLARVRADAPGEPNRPKTRAET